MECQYRFLTGVVVSLYFSIIFFQLSIIFNLVLKSPLVPQKSRSFISDIMVTTKMAFVILKSLFKV